ncbi:MAG: F0F1 ATP synthase subunit A [candidate division Zixibacteria bacterium]|nr:F0F1 ATP synthase subunit A [candidate division Zixibacteria bacterium]
MIGSNILHYLLVASEAGHEAAEHGAGGNGGGHGAEHPELPNFISMIHKIFPDAGWAKFLDDYHVIIYALLIATILSVIAYLGSRNRKLIPTGLQNGVEAVVELLSNFLMGIMGPSGKRFIPFLGTMFIYIFAMNLFGLIPGMHSPTSKLNITLSMAIVVFLYVQYTGIRMNGLGGYLHHLAGSPKSGVEWAMVPLNLPLHVIGEFIKPVSLSLRLFGNISGEDTLIWVFVGLGISTIGFLNLPIGLPLQLPFIFLAMLTSFVQALVFTLLSTIYFTLMFPHEEHAEH